MKGKELVSAYGLGAEAMKIMANLARQVRKQGGKEEDVRLLENETILQKVAKVLASAGILGRPFDILCHNGHDSWITVFLHWYDINSIADLGEAVASWNGLRLLTKDELEYMWQKYPNLLEYEKDLFIVGEKVPGDDEYWTLTKEGFGIAYITNDKDISKNYCFAVTFDSSRVK